MRVYKIKQNRRKIYTAIAMLLAAGVLLLTVSLLDFPFSSICQFAGVICFAGDIAIYDRYLSGGFHVAIDERQDDISIYPKLYIYTTKGKHNITNAKVCIPFSKVVCVRRSDRVKRIGGVGITNLCADIDRENICYVEYEEAYCHSGVYFNADDSLYDEIVNISKKYSGLEEEDRI